MSEYITLSNQVRVPVRKRDIATEKNGGGSNKADSPVENITEVESKNGDGVVTLDANIEVESKDKVSPLAAPVPAPSTSIGRNRNIHLLSISEDEDDSGFTESDILTELLEGPQKENNKEEKKPKKKVVINPERGAKEIQRDFKFQLRNLSVEDAMAWKREAMKNVSILGCTLYVSV
jgi:hypothetical protein